MNPLLRVLILALAVAPAGAQTHWVATWAFSPSPQRTESEMQAAKLVFENQTLREVVHVSIGGSSVRVRLSNVFGKDEVTIAAAHIAVRGTGSSIVAGSDRGLTFSGRAIAVIPANAILLSDPVNLTVPDGGDLAISLFVPKRTVGAGIHYGASQTNYVAEGDQTAAAELTGATTVTSWVFVGGVDVAAAAGVSAIATFGDSITDGARSTADANRRWPDVLAERLRKGGKKLAVINGGIGGNRILHDALPASIFFGVNALARFERDVLAQPGVKYVIVLEGINDLGHAGTSAPESETVTAEDLIAGMRQMIERAHEKGMKIFGCTILPFKGTVFKGYYSEEKDAKRVAVNQWMRTSKAFDGVIDFEKVTQDPAHPGHILAAYDAGDHLHPGDAGYKAMGEAIPLSLFQ
ncbi:MAG: SGNH/GDSL hydrolase family protein [Bryobacteraceae bacterium]